MWEIINPEEELENFSSREQYFCEDTANFNIYYSLKHSITQWLAIINISIMLT